MDVDEQNSQEEMTIENSKKVRKRKKNLYKSILQQMEFYFSDANVKKDRFIGQLIQENPYVDLSIFLKFNKIASLTNKIEEICCALEKSEFLKLSDDKKKVCRTTPITDKENEDECTIYVERLPEDATHDWLKETFSKFGLVDYVSLPKYKHNKRQKGFAFIEYNQMESAKKALTYFESIGCKLTMEMAPNQLASIITFEPDNYEEKPTTKKNKRKLNEEDDDHSSKKMKIDKGEVTGESRGSETNSEQNEELEEKFEENRGSDEVKEEKCGEVEGEMEGELNKKKRKRKKHRRGKDDLKQLGLQVLSKKEWKQLRNKYLNMQRIKMKTLKEHLFRHRHYNRQIQDGNVEKNENEVKTEPKFKFMPECIIQFSIPEGFTDIKKLKSDIRTNPGVEFIDALQGKEIGYVRFTDSKSCKDFLTSNFFDSSKILEGQDEKDYWNKIMKDRDTKLNKNQPTKKIRGREKLLKKAEQELGKHIRFDN